MFYITKGDYIQVNKNASLWLIPGNWYRVCFVDAMNIPYVYDDDGDIVSVYNSYGLIGKIEINAVKDCHGKVHTYHAATWRDLIFSFVVGLVIVLLRYS